MGGGEGSTAREILRHETVEKVIMCDIDEVLFFDILFYLFFVFFFFFSNVVPFTVRVAKEGIVTPFEHRISNIRRKTL